MTSFPCRPKSRQSSDSFPSPLETCRIRIENRVEKNPKISIVDLLRNENRWSYVEYKSKNLKTWIVARVLFSSAHENSPKNSTEECENLTHTQITAHSQFEKSEKLEDETEILLWIKSTSENSQVFITFGVKKLLLKGQLEEFVDENESDYSAARSGSQDSPSDEN